MKDHASTSTQGQRVHGPVSTHAPGGSSVGMTGDGPRQLQQGERIAQLRRAAPASNRTGLPESLKSGIEALSGMDMSGVRVHRNSSKPATLQAHAYAQGTDIHLGPGQERHLPHEAWHVVQQAQGRVGVTQRSERGEALNDSPELEHEATVMGERALQLGPVRTPYGLAPLGRDGNTHQLFGFKDYFWGPAQPALPVAAPHAAPQNDLPANHSATRSSYLGWYDWAKQGANAGWSLLQPDAAVPNESPLLRGVRTMGGVVTGAAGGLIGGAIGTVGSLAHTVHKGVSGAWDHSRHALELADGDVEAAGQLPGNGYLANAKKKGLASLAGLVSPIARGLGSGFIGQGQNAQARPSAMSDIYTRMSDGSGGSLLEKAGAGAHAVLGGLLQSGIGGLVGTAKSTKNLVDAVSGLIAPGPISSITGPMGAHQMLERSSDPGSQTMGTVGASGDSLGALAQLGSATLNIPASALNYLLADRSTEEGRFIAKENLKEQWQGIGSNLARGGGFTLAEMSKGRDASWLTQQTGLESALPTGMAYGAGGIYSAYHLWKGGWAAHDYYKYRNMANTEQSDQHAAIGSGVPTTDLDKFLLFAREKKQSSVLRNSLALASLGLGMGGLPVMAGAIGLGLGGMQLWHWLSDGSRDTHANWLVAQAQGPVAGTTQELVNMLIPADLLALIQPGANPTPDIIATARKIVEERLASW